MSTRDSYYEHRIKTVEEMTRQALVSNPEDKQELLTMEANYLAVIDADVSQMGTHRAGVYLTKTLVKN